jgi:transposase-like protein
MIAFPLDELLNEDECYAYLRDALHPEGLACPNDHPLPPDQAPHTRERAPIVNYRCRECGAVFNIFTDTVWQNTAYDACTIVMLLRGFAKGVPTLQLTDEMDLDYGTVLKRRHRIQEAVAQGEPTGLPDIDTDDEEDNEGADEEENDEEEQRGDIVEVDETYVNAGEKRASGRD